MKKTIEWLRTLDEPYRTQAIINTSVSDLLVQKDSLEEALADAFYWGESPEGDDYWSEIFSKISYPLTEKPCKSVNELTESKVDHPSHYGGSENPYEAIKVIEAWDLGFNLGNVVKYISRAGKKGNALEDLEKARFYLNREIYNLNNNT